MALALLVGLYGISLLAKAHIVITHAERQVLARNRVNNYYPAGLPRGAREAAPH